MCQTWSNGKWKYLVTKFWVSSFSSLSRYLTGNYYIIGDVRRHWWKCWMSCKGFALFFYLYSNIVLSMLYAEICLKIRRHNAWPKYNNIVLSMLYAEICPKVRRHNAHNIIVIITLNVFGDFKKWNFSKMYW